MTPPELLSEDHYWAKEEIGVCYQNIAFFRSQMAASIDIDTMDEYNEYKKMVRSNLKKVIENKKILNYNYSLDEKKLNEL